MLALTSSPFAHGRRTTPQIMRMVCYALIPGTAVQIYFFGWGTLVQLLLALISAVIAEGLVLWLRKRPLVPTLTDYSALLTGWLLAISIPPASPWWLIVMGTLFAVIMVKQLYGGLGGNLFNPAMAGYVMLLISFPVLMTTWLPTAPHAQYQFGFTDTLSLIFSDFTTKGFDLQQAAQWVDGTTSATPLDAMKTGLQQGLSRPDIMQSYAFNGWVGAGWIWVNLAYLLGGLILLQQRIINWHIPTAMLAMLLVCSTIGAYAFPDHSTSLPINMLSGATMLGAFFIATDPVSASTTRLGRLLYGALIGFLVYAIRTWGGYPDAVAFSVLLANMTVPLIDYYTRPRSYGHKGAK